MFIEMPTFDAFYRDVYQDLGRFIKIWGFIRIWGGLGYGEVLSRLLSGYGEVYQDQDMGSFITTFIRIWGGFITTFIRI